jgi:hypothetical protein
MIDSSQFKEVLRDVLVIARTIHGHEHLTRNQVEDIRTFLILALSKTNQIERAAVDVPPPSSGE